MKPLTAKQQAVLDFIKAYIEEHGYAPSLADVSAYFGVSVNGALCFVVALEKKGKIKRTQKISRGLAIL